MEKKDSVNYKKRFFEILEIFSKYEMAYIFKGFRNKKKHPFDRGARIRKILEELGPTFIKFGQMMSTRNDILPNDIINELTKLQDEVPAISFEKAFKEVLERKPDFFNLFKSIDPFPIGSASIAQVYKAVLHDESEVVIKVRRPEIKRVISEDIEVLRHVGGIVQFLPQFKDFNLMEIIEEFGKSIFKEMDFIEEANNMNRFSELFRSNEHIFAPITYESLCEDDLIIMEYIKGHKFSELINGKDTHVFTSKQKEELLIWGADSLFQQVFTIGFLHSDPHAGNLIITEDERIYFVDFGQVSIIDKHTRRILLELLIAITRRDSQLLASIISENFYSSDEDGLNDDIKKLFSKYYGKAISDFKLSDMFVNIFDVIRKRRISVPPQLLLMSKIILLLESNAKKLKNDFNTVEFTENFFKKRWTSILYDRMEQLKEEAVWDFLMAPRNLQKIKKVIDSGKIKLEMEMPKIEKILMALKFALNSLAISIIIASLLISINNFENQILAYLGVAILGLFVIYEFISEGRR